MEYECFSAVLDPLHRPIGIGGVEILHPRLGGGFNIFFIFHPYPPENMIQFA